MFLRIFKRVNCADSILYVMALFPGKQRLSRIASPDISLLWVPRGVMLFQVKRMRRNRAIKLISLAGLVALISPLALAQQSVTSVPPPYRGVSEHVDGVFVTPVANVPFSATAELESVQILADGSSVEKKTINNIARDSAGRIYNERRRMVPSSFTGTPEVDQSHIYDPETRLNTFLDPATQIAHQSVLTKPLAAPALVARVNSRSVQEEDLGSDIMENVAVRGTRRTRTISAQSSGTGQAVVVIDEYWYSDDLHLNMLVKHDDPRTGHQTVTVTHVTRAEPPETVFEIPSTYRVVDETPVSR